MENYIGRLLDNRYEILEVIGTGGMAVVYKARCHRLNRLVAIKILKDDLSQDAEFRRRFYGESQAVAMLSHPNIVAVYDVSHSDNTDYIVMELVDGISLKQYMEQKGTLNWREVLHFATQIAKALEHAHSRGIIHRDIKPHNIMVLKDGSVKVADFGIARVSSSQSTLTREALGSVHYISPEQAKGGKIDYRSDLYSLGVVMYEMLTGRPPYDGETPVSVAIQHINAHAVQPRSINTKIPVGLEQITMRAMAADLVDRYENAGEMLRDLDEFRKNPNMNFAFIGLQSRLPNEKQEKHQTAADRAVHGRGEGRVNHQNRAQKMQARSGFAGLIAGIICIALAILGIGYFLYSFFLSDIFSDTEDIPVPKFVGKYVDNINLDAYPEFDIFIEQWITNDSVEQGYIISQDPKPDRMVKAGSSIALTVSAGVTIDSMRDLSNQSLQNAKTILENLRLNIQFDVIYENNDTVAEGCVIRTIPGKSESLTEGQIVTLVVSSGPTAVMVPVPELVGLNVQRAIEKIKDSNLLYDLTYVNSDKISDTIVYQSIKQGEFVKENSTINLQVSSGPDHSNNTAESEPGTEISVPNLPQTRLIDILLPQGTETIAVSVYVDGVYEDSFEVDPVTVVNNKIQIAVDNIGVRQIDILIDGVLWNSISYDFDKGVVLY